MNPTDGLEETDAQAEQIFLGTLLNYPRELADARDSMPVDGLRFDCHQRIYRALLRLSDRKALIDPGSLRDELRQAGDWSDVGEDLLTDIACIASTASALPRRIDQLRGKALARSLSRFAAALVAECESPTGPPAEVLDRAQAELAKLAVDSAGSHATIFSDVVRKLFDEIDARKRGESRSAVPTGFVQTDELLLGGLPIGGLTILAARPSVGKTSLAGHIARNVAARGSAVLFVSLEQQQLELAERVMAGESKVSGKRIRTADLEPRHTERLTAAAQSTRNWRLWIDDRTAATASQIAAGIRHVRRVAKGLDLVVVDYLNLIRTENPKLNRNEQVGSAALRLRETAREMGVAVLLLCQLNRDSAHEQGPPKLHHLRDSGEIEQHADAVLFLHRTADWLPNQNDRLELHVSKQRNGPLGNVAIEHDSRVYSFNESSPI